MATSTTSHVVHVLDSPGAATVVRRRRLLHRLTTGLIGLIIGLAALDGLGLVDAFGVDHATVSASADGTTLEVVYPDVTRPALASPLRITLHREGGWGDQPVTIAIDRSYLEIWDVNGIIPAPASESTDGPLVLWEMEPPEGDTLVVTYEARIEPAVQSSRRGRVWLVEDGEKVLGVRFTTHVRP